jgi:DNA-binding beta-propeller fold protein YncE
MQVTSCTPRWHRHASEVAIALALTFAAFVTPAGAAAPGLIFSAPASGGSGSGAGQFDNPRGVAVDSGTGHVYVAGGANNRVDEFDHEGTFVKAWGWGVADGTTAALQTCTTTCFDGLSGSGAGQFNFPLNIAVDSDTSAPNLPPEGIYVGDFQNFRVQKFDSEGNFLLMFGGEVNKTTSANVCTKADLLAGQQCGVGVAGEGPGEFATTAVGSYIAVGADGTVYVGDKGRIQEFDENGAFVGEVELTGELAGKTVRQLAVDASGNFYVVFSEFASSAQNDRVWKLGPTGEELNPKFSVQGPGALTVDSDGNLFVVEDPFHFGIPELHARVIEFDAAGNKLIPTKEEEENEEYFAQLPGNVNLLGLATDACPNGDWVLYVTDRGGSLRAFGTPLTCRGGGDPEPTIEAQYATSVGTDSAVLRAEINPDFSSTVTYYLRYGLADCDTGPCAEVPLPPGLPLAGSGGSAVRTAGIPLSGLEPGTTYHFQFVAVSGAFTVEGDDQTFTTFRPLPEDYLPDARAYEMVSPSQKNSGEVAQRGGISNALLQASPDGSAVSYGSNTAFGEAQSAPAISQYLSRRATTGWTTDNITPPDQSGILENAVRGFFRDLSTTALVVREPPLCCGASTGVDNLYLRDNADGGLTLLTPGEPKLSIPRSDYCISYGGASADGSRVIFSALGALTADAPDGSGFNLYEWSQAGGLRLVSVLPNGDAAAPSQFTGFGAGMADGCKTGRRIVRHAISADGTKIFWTRAGGTGLFARIGGTETVQLDLPQGGTGAAGTGLFWAASSDGSQVLFTALSKLTPGAQPNDLYLYDFDQPLGARLTNLTAGPSAAEVRGLVGASDAGDRAYFVARGVLAANEGAAVEPGGTAQTAKPGENNLYLWRQGEPLRFVTALAEEADAAAWAQGPEFRTARSTPDGEHLAFLSVRQLTPQENIDQDSGEAVREVYLYDATAHDLVCASCNPSGARPLGPSALTAWKIPFEQARFLSDDGGRLFFESFDSLDPRDVNGLRDVYEFEREGVGDCGTASPTFNEATGACVSLISTGRSTSDSYFLDASTSGDDVFLSTRQPLVGADEDDYYDVYDARVGGGFPDPPPPPEPCAGETCRGPSSQPGQPGTAGSAAFVGPGDPAPLRCRKGQVKRKGKCVKKSKAGKRRRAAARKRAGRRAGRR